MVRFQIGWTVLLALLLAAMAPVAGAQRRGGGMRRNPGLGAGLARARQMPPEQREQQLHNSAAFQHMSPEMQQRVEKQLHRFNAMTPQQQQHLLRQLRALGSLNQKQRAGLADVYKQFQQMPQPQRKAFRQAYNRLRKLPPDQRKQQLNDPALAQQFSPEQIGSLRKALNLNLPPVVVGNRP